MDGQEREVEGLVSHVASVFRIQKAKQEINMKQAVGSNYKFC
jgi:hypothetical protein